MSTSVPYTVPICTSCDVGTPYRTDMYGIDRVIVMITWQIALNHQSEFMKWYIIMR